LHISYFNLTIPDLAVDEAFEGATELAAEDVTAEELTELESLTRPAGSSKLNGLTYGVTLAFSESCFAEEPD